MEWGKNFHQSLNWTKIPVEFEDGTINDIDFSKSIPDDAQFSNYILNDWRARFEVLSGMHKSLRLGHINYCLNWARIYSMQTSEEATRKYLMKILFEESRSLSLFHLFTDTKNSLENLIIAFCKATKKWQIPGYSNHCDLWSQGYFKFRERMISGITLDLQSILNELSNFKDMAHLYELSYWIKGNKIMEAPFRQRMIEMRPDQSCLKDLFDTVTSKFGTSYPRILGLEILGNYWNHEANNFKEDISEYQFFIPSQRPWMFDWHTRKGKKVLQQISKIIKPNAEFPSREICPRLSGSIIGVAFRHRCPSPLSKEWGEVYFSDEDWLLTQIHNSYYYP